MEVQTRSEESGLGFHSSIREAFDAADKDRSIWKISFTVHDEDVRFLRDGEGWIYSSIRKEVAKYDS